MAVAELYPAVQAGKTWTDNEWRACLNKPVQDDLPWLPKILCHLFPQLHPKTTDHNQIKIYEHHPVRCEMTCIQIILTETPLGPGMPGIPASPCIPCEI